jgi:hypothetical protein
MKIINSKIPVSGMEKQEINFRKLISCFSNKIEKQ